LPKTMKEFESLPSTVYSTIEAIINDGWKVD